ncbi:MAG TPA: hypothetical protein VL985_16940 [Stellaceae bacterium]|nr:hypothetical protein [Stellaceae bacterium]
MRYSPLFAAVIVAMSFAATAPAHAGLVGNGTNTVAALFYSGASSVPVVTSSTAPYTNPVPYEIEGPSGPTNPPPLPSIIPAHFSEGAADLSTIDVGDTQIIITNEAPPSMPFCSTALPCSDVFTGFGFAFFGNVDITNVTVDPTSATDFMPIAGGLNFGATDIFANVAGDAPASGDQLILDVTTAVTPPPVVPEPASALILMVGLTGLWPIRRLLKRADVAA